MNNAKAEAEEHAKRGCVGNLGFVGITELSPKRLPIAQEIF